jgi:hypothetical protein
MSMFLNAEEIAELTGRKRVHLQLEWLTQRGWLHEVNAAGRPIILRNYAENRLSGRKPNQPTNPPAIVPNFAAIKNTPLRCNKR